jgi:hypothetical protein
MVTRCLVEKCDKLRSHTSITTQDSFTENNYRVFFGLALDVLIRPWEKLVLGQKYNEVGHTFASHALW